MLEERDDAEVDHVDHGCVAGNEEEEGDLDGVGLGEVPRFDLVRGMRSKHLD